MERWCCLDCQARVELDSQLRCGVCGSEAVDTMERFEEANLAVAVAAPTPAPKTQDAPLFMRLGALLKPQGVAARFSVEKPFSKVRCN